MFKKVETYRVALQGFQSRFDKFKGAALTELAKETIKDYEKAASQDLEANPQLEVPIMPQLSRQQHYQTELDAAMDSGMDQRGAPDIEEVLPVPPVTQTSPSTSGTRSLFRRPVSVEDENKSFFATTPA